MQLKHPLREVDADNRNFEAWMSLLPVTRRGSVRDTLQCRREEGIHTIKISRRLAQDFIRLAEFPVLTLQSLQTFGNFCRSAAAYAVVDLSSLDPLIERLSRAADLRRQSKSPSPTARNDPSHARKPAERRVPALRVKTASSSCLPSLHLLKVRSLRQAGAVHIAKVADAYHSWRETDGRYADEAGFCKAATTEQIAAQGYVLTPGRYVGTAAAEEDDEPFEERMARLTAALREQMAESARLDEHIRQTFVGLGYGW